MKCSAEIRIYNKQFSSVINSIIINIVCEWIVGKCYPFNSTNRKSKVKMGHASVHFWFEVPPQISFIQCQNSNKIPELLIRKF